MTQPPRIMKWFTRDWHTGGLSDEQHDAALSNYVAHAASLRTSESPAIRDLLGLNLHDAQVKEWSMEAATFSWRLLIGDLQRNYEFVTLTYSEADLLSVDVAALRSLRFSGSRELVSDEVDRAEGGRSEHRFYFDDTTEFGVRFRDVEVKVEPATPADRL